MTGHTFDVVVVGAGMLGAAAAFHLARQGADVAVLDAAEPATGATGNSFAWLNAVGKTPESYHHLNAAGMVEYDELYGYTADAEPRGSGCLEWAGTTGGEQSLIAKVARLQGWGYPARLISRAEAQAREPGLMFGSTDTIALYERDRWVDAPTVVRALLKIVQDQGGLLRTETPVIGFATEGGRVTGVQTAAGPVGCRTLLLCAGAGTSTLTARLGVPIPIHRSPGLLAITSPLNPLPLSHLVYAPGIHLRPDVNGGLRLGADDIDALTTKTARPGPPPPWALPLIDRAAAVLPAAAGARIDRVHIGVRPIPADGHTVAGRLPGVANAFVAVTHSGITLGPLLGRLMAEEIAGAQPDPLLTDFRPERFSDTPATTPRAPAH